MLPCFLCHFESSLVESTPPIDPHLTLSRYIHLLMTYEHLTSRGDNSPKWTEIEFCNQPCLIVMKLEKTYPIQSRSNTKLTN